MRHRQRSGVATVTPQAARQLLEQGLARLKDANDKIPADDPLHHTFDAIGTSFRAQAELTDANHMDLADRVSISVMSANDRMIDERIEERLRHWLPTVLIWGALVAAGGFILGVLSCTLGR